MRTHTFFKIFSVIATLLFCSSLEATEQRWTHFGLRPLGMGNAYVAVADDFNALFYNPAGLARLKEWDGELLNPGFEAAKASLDFVNDLLKLSSGSSSDFASILDLFKQQSGKIHYVAMSLTPHLIFRNFGFGLGISLPASLVTHSNINIEFDAGARVIAPLSFAFNFLDNKLSIGASAKMLARGGINHDFTLETLSAFGKADDKGATELSDLFEAGTGVGLDLGMLFTPVETMRPTLGISIADVGGTPYKKAGTAKAGVPAARLPAVNTGVSLVPYESGSLYWLVAADAHMINQPLHYSHKLNFGTEFGLGQILKLQAGLKEGYLTSGVQFDVGLLNLRLATYAVDHGTVVGLHNNLVERRYALQIKLLI